MIDKSYVDDDLRQRSINLGKMFKKLTGFFRISKEIDFEDLSRYSDSIMHDIGNYIEKNWVLFDDNGFEKCIYQWYPLTIGTIDNEKKEFIKTNQLNVPPFFKYVRGSSNGIIIKDEIWTFN